MIYANLLAFFFCTFFFCPVRNGKLIYIKKTRCYEKKFSLRGLMSDFFIFISECRLTSFAYKYKSLFFAPDTTRCFVWCFLFPQREMLKNPNMGKLFSKNLWRIKKFL